VGPTLHPHQEDAVSKLGNGKVLWGDVGTGKSITAAAYYVRNETPKDIYIITTAKKRNSLDWEKEFAAFAISKNPDATIAGVLTVDSWNNIGRYTDVTDAFFIFDEQRAVGSGAWADALIKIAKRNRWIMLSATPGDGWLDYIPLFVANGFYKNRTAFLREHAVFNRFAKYPKVDRFMGEGKLVRYKEQLLVEMPYERHTRRIVSEVCLEHDSEALERVFKGRWNVFEEKPLRDIAELFTVARKVVNSDPSRLEFVRSLMTRHPRLIVFYNFDYELEMLRTLASSTTTTPSLSSSESLTTCSTTSLTQKRSGTRSTSTTSLSYESESQASTVACFDRAQPTSASDESTSETERTTEWPSSSGAEKTGPTPPPASTGSSSRQKGAEATSCTTASAVAHASRTSSSMDESGRSCVPDSSSSRSDPAPETTRFTLAEWNGHKHQEVPETDRWVYLVQYTAGSEGWNCVTTDAMVFWSLTYSYKAWHQAFGRIDRLNTPFTELHYYVLQSNSWIDQAVRKSLGQKKNFNENRYSMRALETAA